MFHGQRISVMKTNEEIKDSLQSQGIVHLNEVFYNLSRAELYEHAISNSEAELTEHGALLAITVPHTGRSANDKFLVEEPSSSDKVWWGKVNKPFPQEKFNALKARMTAYLQGSDVYVLDCFAGADDKYALPVRVVNQYAWHNLFAQNMFIQAEESQLNSFEPGFTILHCPDFKADPAIDGTRSETFILMDFAQKLVLIGGTNYAGEIKKSIFTALNYLMPLQGVMSMHCSANIGTDGDTALFFGLSGTGKTTLSTDPERALIGDDEHGWSDAGTFNYEGGCYAKVINLSKEAEPIIYDMTKTFGTILENVPMDSESRKVDLFDDSITENTRASYPRAFIDNIVADNKGGHPKNIFFLTADAFGVLPPISKLNPGQAKYQFISGYTAKVAGTEAGVKEPQATFSPCYGQAFLPLHPTKYAKLLGELLTKHKVNVWLINTGWSGGPYGVGSRMQLPFTRAMITAALEGKLDNATYVQDPLFGFSIPTAVPGVPTDVLIPRNTWVDKAAYDEKANELASKFNANFDKYREFADEEMRAAAPKVLQG